MLGQLTRKSSLHDTDDENFNNFGDIDINQERNLPAQQRSIKAFRGYHQLLSPAGILETSPSFCPEMYTSEDAGPALLVTKIVLEECAPFTRTSLYSLLYRRSPRQWMRITTSVTLSVESKFWNVGRLEASSSEACEDLPGNLDSILQKFLDPRTDLRQDTHVRVFLGGQSFDETTKATTADPQIDPPPLHITEYLGQMTSTLHHSGCIMYLESELTHFPLYRYEQTHWFVSRFRDTWALDFRFGSNKADIEATLYHLRALHCLQGSPGICPFMGAITGDVDGLAKGFLAKMPSKGLLFRLMDLAASETGSPVSWLRRERWCKQLVQAVAQVHSKSMVVGILGKWDNPNIGIDEQDNAVLLRVQPSFIYGLNVLAGMLPPEFAAPSMAVEGILPATPQTDIYQLGLLLWRIAKGYCAQVSSAQLPSPGPGTPQYLEEIISACRRENPHQRPAAWELAGMFPSEVGQRESECAPATTVAHPSDFELLFGTVAWCNLCAAETTDHFFQCNICSIGDFDMCPGCLGKGRHCYQPDHYLSEYHLGELRTFRSGTGLSGQKTVVPM